MRESKRTGEDMQFYSHETDKSVGFEKPLAISEIDSGEKNAEKKEELYSFFFLGVFVHT